MKLTRNLAVAASALVITGSAGIASSAVQAAPAPHCDGGLGKVELDGASASVDAGLAPGTEVCIKAGKSIAYITVDADGFITNDELFNQNGNARGISYYVWYSDTTLS